MHMGYYRNYIMKQGNRNAPATILQAMYEIFIDMVFKELVIYIKYNIIISDNYDEHVATLRKNLQYFLDKKFSWKPDKYQFFTKCRYIIGHVWTPDRLHMDSKKSMKVLNFQVPNNCQELQGMISVVIFLGKLCAELQS